MDALQGGTIVPSHKFDDYEVLVRHRNGTFYVIIHELGLIGAAKRLEDAWADGAAKFDCLISAYCEAGVENRLPTPTKIHLQNNHQSRPAGIGSFIVKMAIVFVAIVGIVWMGSFIAARTIRHSVEKISVQSEHLGGKKFWGKIEAEIGKAADQKISPEKQAEITEKLRRIVAQAKPYADELAPLFTGPTQPADESRK